MRLAKADVVTVCGIFRTVCDQRNASLGCEILRLKFRCMAGSGNNRQLCFLSLCQIIEHKRQSRTVTARLQLCRQHLSARILHSNDTRTECRILLRIQRDVQNRVLSFVCACFHNQFHMENFLSEVKFAFLHYISVTRKNQVFFHKKQKKRRYCLCGQYRRLCFIRHAENARAGCAPPNTVSAACANVSAISA